MGRPSKFTPELAKAIQDRLEAGESLKRICEDSGMPDRETVRRWMKADESFAAECARAREDSADAEYEAMGEIEGRVLNGSLDPQAASVVLSNKRWRMEKLKPRVYGNKQQIDLTAKVTLEDLLVSSK